MDDKRSRNQWCTPKALVEYCEDLLGGLDYDTACTVENAVAPPVWLGDARQDALVVPWEGRVFCNPPYDDIGPWIDKALESDRASVAMVLPSPNGERRYYNLINRSFEVHLIGRIAFLRRDGTPVGGNPRGTSVFLINAPDMPAGRRGVMLRDWLTVGV